MCLLIQGNTANVFYMIMNLENMANMLYANMIFLVFNSKVIILLFSVIVFSSVKGDGCLSKHLLLEHKYSKPFNSHE